MVCKETSKRSDCQYTAAYNDGEWERVLSIPDDGKYAFLMSLHPRLGAKSPARHLIMDRVKLVRLVFTFLDCRFMSTVSRIVLCRPVGTQQLEDVQRTGLEYVNIVQKWKHWTSPHTFQKKKVWVLMQLSFGKGNSLNIMRKRA